MAIGYKLTNELENEIYDEMINRGIVNTQNINFKMKKSQQFRITTFLSVQEKHSTRQY